MEELFDGRLEKWGIFEATKDKKVVPDKRCLADGENYVWVFSCEDGMISGISIYGLYDPYDILKAISDRRRVGFAVSREQALIRKCDFAYQCGADHQSSSIKRAAPLSPSMMFSMARTIWLDGTPTSANAAPISANCCGSTSLFRGPLTSSSSQPNRPCRLIRQAAGRSASSQR
jgi:hypothetical protein